MPFLQGLKSADTGELVALRELNVNATIHGLSANVEATLHYRNMDFVPIGAQFSCLLGDHCVLYKFEAEIAGRTIVAECVDRKKIEETFEENIASIRRRYRYSPLPADSFRCYLGNLPPDKDAVIRLAVASELHVEPDGSVYFQLPTVLNPPYSQFCDDVRGSRGSRLSGSSFRGSVLSVGSYGRGNRLSGRNSWRSSWASWASGTPGSGNTSANTSFSFIDVSDIPYSLNLHILIKGSQEIKEVKSRHAKLDLNFLDLGHKTATVALSDQYHFVHELSLRIYYTDTYKSQVIIEKGSKEKAGSFGKNDVLMMDFCPDLSEAIHSRRKSNRGEFIFFIDRSGSMRGDKIQQARMALVTFLKSLPIGCYFNIIGFGNDYIMCFPGGSKVYNKENVSKAMRFQALVHSNMGGSELIKPLKHVYKRRPMRNHPRQIFILTDGDVLNKRAVIEVVRKNSKHTRLFVFGIGDNVSASLVKGLARAGKGKYEFINDLNKLQSTVTSMLKTAMQPCLCDISLQFDLPKGIEAQLIPSKISALYSGQRLISYATLKKKDDIYISQNLSGSLTLKGIVSGKPYRQTLEFSLINEEAVVSTVHCLAAKAQIVELEMDDDELRETGVYKVYGEIYSPSLIMLEARAVLMSIESNIKSRYTTYVAYNKDTGERVTNPMRPQMTTRPKRSRSMSSLSKSSTRKGKVRNSLLKEIERLFTLRAVVKDGRPRASSMPSLHQKSAPLADLKSELKVSQWDLGFQTDREWKLFLNNISASGGLVQLQNFDGSWDMEKKLCYILQVPFDEIQNLKLYKNERVWATILAVWCLRDKYFDKQDEWEMIEIKAIQWLNDQQELDDCNIDELIEHAGKVVLELRKKNGIKPKKTAVHHRTGSGLSWDYMTTGELTAKNANRAHKAMEMKQASQLSTFVSPTTDSETGTLTEAGNTSMGTNSEIQLDSSFELDGSFNLNSNGMLLVEPGNRSTPTILVNGHVPLAEMDEMENEADQIEKLFENNINEEHFHQPDLNGEIVESPQSANATKNSSDKNGSPVRWVLSYRYKSLDDFNPIAQSSPKHDRKNISGGRVIVQYVSTV